MLLVIYKIKSKEVDLQLFEDIYQKLISKEKDDNDPLFPVKFKAEFILIFFKMFMNNGCYSRCESLLEAQKELYERNKDNEYIAFYYHSTYLSATLEFMTLKSSTPERHFKRYYSVDEESKTEEIVFPEEVQNDLDFLRNKLLCQYYLETDKDKAVETYDVLLSICVNTKLMYYMHEASNLLFALSDSFYDEMIPRRKVLQSLLETEIKDHPDKNMAFSNIYCNIFKIYAALEDKSKDGLTKIEENLTAIYEHNRMTSFFALHYDVCLSVPLFSIDPKFVSQDKLFIIKRELTKLSKILENPNTKHEINYYKIPTF